MDENTKTDEEILEFQHNWMKDTGDECSCLQIQCIPANCPACLKRAVQSLRDAADDVRKYGGLLHPVIE